MNLEDIKQYLEENKGQEDVQEFLRGFKGINPDDFKAFLEKEEGKQFIQPTLDRYHSKSLDSWKANNLQKLIDEEVRKRNPDETPEQKRIRELEDYVKQKEQENLRSELKNKALTVATEKEIPSSIIDYFIGKDEESTLENLGKFEESMSTYVQSQVDKRLKDNDYKPPASGGKGDLSVGSKFAEVANEQAKPIENTIWD